MSSDLTHGEFGRGADRYGNRIVLIRGMKSDPVGEQGETLLCLSQRDNDGVKDCDIVLPQWVLDILGVQNLSIVFVLPVLLGPVNPAMISRIELIYKGCKSYRHWDEVSTECRLKVPGIWSTDWPSGISRKALQKFLPVILQSKKLADNTLLVVDVLDNTMVRLLNKN